MIILPLLMNEIARLGIAVIVVSSEGVRFHEGDSSDIAKPEHLVPSWTLEEYTAACSDDRFWAACLNKFSGATVVDNLACREELLREKFAVAGHSARYMLKLLVEEARMKIEGAAQGMGGITTLEDAAKHTRCEGAVNTLVARLLPIVEDGVTLAQAAVFPIKEDTELVAARLEDVAPTAGEFERHATVPRIVSQFATEKMVDELPSDIKRLRGIARKLDNRTIEGYAFEEQLKKSLVEAQTVGGNFIVHGETGNISYPVQQVIPCDAGEIVNVLKNPLVPNTWVFVAGRQGAFDAVHVVSATHQRFVQITVGIKHSFKLDIIERLLRDVANPALTHIEFVLLRPQTERGKTFTLEHADGGNQLRVYRRFDNVNWSAHDFYRVNVQYAFLAWTDVI